MELEFELNDSQYDVLTSDKRETFFISGVGGGKSFTLGAAILTLGIPGSVGFLGSPTQRTLKNSTLPQVQEALEKLGVYENVHYVINERPPESWDVKPFSKLGSDGVITFAWGAYLLVGSIFNFDVLRGTQFDYILIDEFRDVKEGAREVMIARLRGVKYKEEGMTHRIIYATTPPENPVQLSELSKEDNPDIMFVMSTSFENKHNLPEGYIDALLRAYDDETAQREVYGMLLARVKNQFAYKFDKKKHCRPLKMKKRDDFYLSFDFNVNPMTCLLIQSDLETYINVLKEYRIPDSNTPGMCDEILSDIGHLDPYIFVTGDASGDNRNAAIRGSLSHYEIIMDMLDLGTRQINTPKFNASISNSRVLLNSMLQNFGRFFIDEEKCPYLVKDLQFVQADFSKPGKVGIVKSGKSESGMDYESMTHLLDCLRYFLQTYFFDFVKVLRE